MMMRMKIRKMFALFFSRNVKKRKERKKVENFEAPGERI